MDEVNEPEITEDRKGGSSSKKGYEERNFQGQIVRREIKIQTRSKEMELG